MSERDVIRIGDRVRIVNPEAVVRVGYPLCRGDMDAGRLASELQVYLAARLYGKSPREAIGLLESGGDAHPALLLDPWIVDRRVQVGMSDIVADAMLKRAGWGGDLRSVHTRTDPNIAGRIGYVRGKRVVYSGRRTGCGDEGGFYLMDRVAHVLLEVRVEDIYFEIDRANVRRVE